jgi:aspartate--ammonia ligase
MKRLEFFLYDRYPSLVPSLPEKITFLYSEDLFKEYPDLSSKERENKAAEKYGAVFIIGIGGKLPDGSIHDGRAPDYDDWISETDASHKGLNGDLLVWNPILGNAFEISSMGIRVSPESLERQLKERGCQERSSLYFHRRLLNGELTPSIGGGIGQSRLCMYFLRKAHIGETQVSTWPHDMLQICKQAGINLL